MIHPITRAFFLAAILLACPTCTTTLSTNLNDTSASTTDTSSSNDTGVALSCEAYCTTIMANCTGDNQQYGGKAQCLASCKAFPVGAASDTSTNTLGCRTYHAGAASGDAKLHCPHAGPSGQNACGSPCEGYCQLAMMYCTEANKAKVYDSNTDCMTTCAKAKTDIPYTVKTTDGNEAACLIYHAQEASVAPADHCIGDLAKKDGVTSVTCK